MTGVGPGAPAAVDDAWAGRDQHRSSPSGSLASGSPDTQGPANQRTHLRIPVLRAHNGKMIAQLAGVPISLVASPFR